MHLTTDPERHFNIEVAEETFEAIDQPERSNSAAGEVVQKRSRLETTTSTTSSIDTL